MGFFGKDKYIKKPEMRRFVIMFVSTGVSGLSSFFMAMNPPGEGVYDSLVSQKLLFLVR